MPALAAISAPTARAIRVAARSGLTLLAPVRENVVMVPLSV